MNPPTPLYASEAEARKAEARQAERIIEAFEDLREAILQSRSQSEILKKVDTLDIALAECRFIILAGDRRETDRPQRRP